MECDACNFLVGMSVIKNIEVEAHFDRTNIKMDEGDSSLEPGEVKTPPHGYESASTSSQKVVTTTDDETLNITQKTNKSPKASANVKSASKQESDKCAEKVRAILELDEIRRQEEKQRKKEQKSDTLLPKSGVTKKKDHHKKQKSSKKRDSKKRKSTAGSESDKEAHEKRARKKLKHKKRKHDEKEKGHTSYTTTTTESCESLRSLDTASPPQLDYPIGSMCNIPSTFSRGFAGYNNKATSYRSYNPFVRDYRTDFRHRANDFTPHNRGRYPRYRSQYNSGSGPSGSFHAHAAEGTNYSPPPQTLPRKSVIDTASQLMWTKTKPSISFAFNYIPEHNTTTSKKVRRTSERTGERKKKQKKKSKEREHRSKALTSPKISSHKSSKRKKIRRIRETLEKHNKKEQTLTPPVPKEATVLTARGDDNDIHTPVRKESSTPERAKLIPESFKLLTEKEIKVEKLDTALAELSKGHTKVVGEKGEDIASSKTQAADIFASLTPPKQKSSTPPQSPTQPPPANSKSTTTMTANTSSNIEITNKLQEIHSRIDKLLEDDDLKLEAIQLTKAKLLQQKSREYTDGMETNSKRETKTKKTKDKEMASHERHRSKERDDSNVSKSLQDTKTKEKSRVDGRKESRRQHRSKEDNRDLTPPESLLHSKTQHSVTTPEIKIKVEKDFTPPREDMPKTKTDKTEVIKIKTEKISSPRPLVAGGLHSKNGTSKPRTNQSSPDTDDYSDNWENDNDEELVRSSATLPTSNQRDRESLKNGRCERNIRFSPITKISALAADAAINAEQNSKIQSTTPPNSPPPQKRPVSPPQPQKHPVSPPVVAAAAVISSTPKKAPAMLDIERTKDMQLLYNQFIQSVESANVKLTHDTAEGGETIIDEANKEKENKNKSKNKNKSGIEHLSTTSPSYSSSSSTSSSSTDTSASSSASSSTTSSSESASEDSNDTDMLRKKVDEPTTPKDAREILTETNNENCSAMMSEQAMDGVDGMDDATMPNVCNDLKKLESLEANLLRIQMMRANYDAADEISDELLKMEKLFLQEKQMIINKFKESTTFATAAATAANATNATTRTTAIATTTHAVIKTETESESDLDGMPLQEEQSPEHYLQSRGQFVQSMQKLSNENQTEDQQPQATNILNIKRDVIKLTISPMKLPKTSAVFENDNELDASAARKQAAAAEATDWDAADQEKKSNANTSASTTVKQPKPIKEVAIVKPIMESKDSTSSHNQRRRRSPLRSGPTSPSPHRHATTNTSTQSRSRSRRTGRVRSLSVSPKRHNYNNSGRAMSPQRRAGGPGFSKQSRHRNFDRRSRSRSRSGSRQFNRRLGDTSPVMRKRRPPSHTNDRLRNKHSPRRGSRSRSRTRSRSRSRASCSPTSSRYRSDRYSRSPLPFKPPSPPAEPNMSPNDQRRNSLSPNRHLPRSPKRRPPYSPPPLNSDSYVCGSNRHRSLSPRQHQQRYYKPHSPPEPNNSNNHTNNTSYYFNHSPNRISLDARINIVLNGPSADHNENATTNAIAGYDDYSHYGQYGPAAYMSLPTDSNGFYTNQYVQMANAGGVGIPQHLAATHAMQQQQHMYAGDAATNLYATHAMQQQQQQLTNYYYNRFGAAQPFGMAQPASLLKELPKANTVAVQKGNVLEIVPSNDIIAEQKQNDNEAAKSSANEPTAEQANDSNNDDSKRSILKSLDDAQTKTVRTASVGTSKPKKKVNFEDGVYPNHNSDEEDSKVVEAKTRVKMRRLRKKLGITPQCHSLLKEKARKEKQLKGNADKKTLPPPPPNGLPPPNLEQPIYLRTQTPTPLLYFHFDGVVHSMYVSQMERPIPPRLLNPKCLAASNISAASHPTDSQSPQTYTQSPINANKSKDTSITAFNRTSRTENLSPKMIPSTAAAGAVGSPKINYKLYSPMDNVSNTTEIVNAAALPGATPNNGHNLKVSGNTIHTISSSASTVMANHFLPKRQESPKGANSPRTNMQMGLLPSPIPHPHHHLHAIASNTAITPQARIPVIGVQPTVISNIQIPSVSAEPFMGSPFHSATLNQHPLHTNSPQHYLMGGGGSGPSMVHASSPHMPTCSVPLPVRPSYYNSPIQQRPPPHRPLPNYMMAQPAQSSPLSAAANLSMCHMVDHVVETTAAAAAGTTVNNTDMEKFASPQSMTTIPFGYNKGA